MQSARSTNGSDPLDSLDKYVALLAHRSKLNVENTRKVLKAILESGQRGISDEELSIKFGLSQSEIRRILRLLYNNGLAKYRRGKHPELGATRYYWFIDLGSINIVLLNRKKAVLAKLKKRLEYEKSTTFYYCPYHPERRYTLDEAFDYNFECPKCGAPLEEFDNRDRILVLEQTIRRLEEEIRQDEAKIRAS